ncbi:hypothetical protein [Brucella sp. NBRC 12950]|uniref:hypothetical protein n=1 Tax=Brucella sp. NBRC 12950 TaxID=2994518 RepID=UPI002556ECE1|nr:hypothetical protein [Brucella sp. NBRC 12950]
MSNYLIIEPSALNSLPALRLLDMDNQPAFSSDHARNSVRVPIEVWEATAKAGETSFENIT